MDGFNPCIIGFYNTALFIRSKWKERHRYHYTHNFRNINFLRFLLKPNNKLINKNKIQIK